MLLDRIDIDAHGPLSHVEVGPFVEHLNVICAPEGSGKTAIGRFVRDSLAPREYPLGMLSSSSGRVVWADHHGLLHCRREQDGTPHGRCKIEFEPRGEFPYRYQALEHSWLKGIGQATAPGLAVESIQIPESIVDGVITDTAVTSVARVVSACVRSGLDSPEIHQGLPIDPTSHYHDRDSSSSPRAPGFRSEQELRKELSAIDSELAQRSLRKNDLDSLAARRNRLSARLAEFDSLRESRGRHAQYSTRPPTQESVNHRQRRVTELHQRARELRARQSELRRWIVEIDADIARGQDDRSPTVDSYDAPVSTWSQAPRGGRSVLTRERGAIITQLDQVNAELNACLRQAGELRRSMPAGPGSEFTEYDDRTGLDWIDRDAVVAEIRRIDNRLSAASRYRWLRRRQVELIHQLGGATRTAQTGSPTHSPLAESASQWLARLSAARLRRIEWPHHRFRNDATSYHRDQYRRTGVTIDGRDESDCPAADRALAVIAVRMAAGEFLSKTGRHIPLVLETHRELFNHGHVVPAYCQHDLTLRSNDPFATALHDYATGGRQVVVLTSDNGLTNQLLRVGAREFRIHAEHVIHAHRPLWQSHFEPESYVGPHPHFYGTGDSQWQSVAPSHGHAAPLVDINRDFDEACRDSSGTFARNRSADADSQRTDWARDGVLQRDGHFYSNRYTTDVAGSSSGVAVEKTPGAIAPQNVITPRAKSPFFLTVDSPIDQAPSIDAVAASRLRGVNVTHINHLMTHDSNRLADALGLIDVDAATIRRWQAECRLVCRVPRLRGFDARVLTGCGVTTPAQLASIHPVDLLAEVEAFLSTPQGQKILLSGSSHELSRITSWIATANSSLDRRHGGPTRMGRPSSDVNGRDTPRRYRVIGHGEEGFELDGDAFDVDESPPDDAFTGAQSARRRRQGIVRRMNQRDSQQAGGRSSGSSSRTRNDRGSRSSRGLRASGGSSRRSSSSRRNRSDSRGRTRRSRSRSVTASERDSSRRSYSRSNNNRGSGRGSARRSRRGEVVRYQSGDRERVREPRRRFDRESSDRPPREFFENQDAPQHGEHEKESSRELRFYLECDSPVVDAPSIGSRLGERLEAIGISTVDDLINADAESAVEELDHRRVKVETFIRWQQQAVLVCRVPMLRGHDAQLLVAAEVTTPEELAVSDAEELFAAVDPIARSSEGKRIIRGGKLPDLEEVNDWIRFAQHTRELQAA